AAVTAWLEAELRRYPEMVVLGDFNIAPDERDVHDPEVWHEGHILSSALEREALQRMLALGLHDAYRLHHEGPGEFSWWDYRQAAFRRNLGLRIDLTLVSDALRARCTAAGIDREPRTLDRPSDHAPAWVELAPAGGARHGSGTAPRARKNRKARGLPGPSSRPSVSRAAQRTRPRRNRLTMASSTIAPISEIRMLVKLIPSLIDPPPMPSMPASQPPRIAPLIPSYRMRVV